jgi:hypothetical protein
MNLFELCKGCWVNVAADAKRRAEKEPAIFESILVILQVPRAVKAQVFRASKKPCTLKRPEAQSHPSGKTGEGWGSLKCAGRASHAGRGYMFTCPVFGLTNKESTENLFSYNNLFSLCV